MRADMNRNRIAALQAQEAQRLQADVRARMDDARATRYLPYDDAGDNAASLAMSLVRDALEARLDETFYDGRFDSPDGRLLPIMELLAPKPRTYDERAPLARGYFQSYAQAVMTCATTLQLSQWVERYRAQMAGRDAWASDGLCRETLRGLALLRGYLASLGAPDKADAAYDALLTAYATRMAQAQVARAWHLLSNAVRPYVRPGKRTRLERKVARSHATRAARKLRG